MPNDYLILAVVAVLSIGGGLYLLRQAKKTSADKVIKEMNHE